MSIHSEQVPEGVLVLYTPQNNSFSPKAHVLARMYKEKEVLETFGGSVGEPNLMTHAIAETLWENNNYPFKAIASVEIPACPDDLMKICRQNGYPVYFLDITRDDAYGKDVHNLREAFLVELPADALFIENEAK